jgi:hypothetical protein
VSQPGKPQDKENQKAKGKNQKAKMSEPGRGPDWGGIFRGWPPSKQSSMTQSSMIQFRSRHRQGADCDTLGALYA